MKMPTLREALQDRLRGATSGPIGLIVQGGGMRGVYSMGALAALESEGLSSGFDFVAGASAGAINGAYMIAGQANAAVDVYVNALSNRNFVNPLRFWRMVDIDYMIDDALKKYCPLNLEEIKNSSTLLSVVVTRARDGQRVLITNRDDVDMYELFRATSALPVLYGKSVVLAGEQYIDGGLADGLPLSVAVEHRATDVLAVVTRPSGHRRHGLGKRWLALVRLLAKGQSLAVQNRVGLPNTTYNQAMDVIEGVTPAPFRIRGVWPSDLQRLVSRTTSDRGALQASADLGRADMLAALDDHYPSR